MKKTNMTIKMNEKSNILVDIAIFSSSGYVAKIMFFIRGFLCAKFLGPALYGLWNMVNIILNYSYYVNCGSIEAMGKEISHQEGLSCKKGMVKARNSAFTFCLLANFIFSFTAIILTFVLWNNFSSTKVIGLIATALLLFIFSLHELYRISFIALRKFFFVSKVNIIFSILSVIMTLILVPNFKIYGLYLTILLTALFSVIYYMFHAPYKFKIDFDFNEIRKLIKIGFPLMSIDFLEGAIFGITAMIILILFGKEKLGYYSVAILATRFLMYLPEAMHSTFEPYIYKKYGETNRISALKEYLLKPTLVMSLLFPIIVANYYTLSSFFIRHFLQEYTASIYLFFIILIAIFLGYFSPTSFAFITAINKQRFIVPIYLIGIAMAIVYSLIFANMGFGIMAAAFGVFLSYFFIGAVVFIYALNHYIKNPFRCLSYLAGLYLPILYMILVVFFNETMVSNSLDLLLDIKKLILKLGILFIFAIPLVYVANSKTGILSSLSSFLKLDRFVFKQFRPNYAQNK